MAADGLHKKTLLGSKSQWPPEHTQGAESNRARGVATAAAACSLQPAGRCNAQRGCDAVVRTFLVLLVRMSACRGGHAPPRPGAPMGNQRRARSFRCVSRAHICGRKRDGGALRGLDTQRASLDWMNACGAKQSPTASARSPGHGDDTLPTVRFSHHCQIRKDPDSQNIGPSPINHSRPWSLVGLGVSDKCVLAARCSDP